MLDLSRPLGPARSDHRLTLTTGLPVTTADVTGATSIYFTPAGGGNQILLYTPAGLAVNVVLAEQTLALGTLTSGKPYDAFGWWDGGFQKEYVVWTNDTTRATAITLSNGLWVKSGSTYKRLLGTFYTTSTTATEDSAAKRFLSNAYNDVLRRMQVYDTTGSWVYATDAWQSANASTANRLQFVVPVPGRVVRAGVDVAGNNAVGGRNQQVSIGLDSTTAKSANATSGGHSIAGASTVTMHAETVEVPTPGMHYLQWIESAPNGATVTFFGLQSTAGTTGYIQSGIYGEIAA